MTIGPRLRTPVTPIFIHKFDGRLWLSNDGVAVAPNLGPHETTAGAQPLTLIQQLWLSSRSMPPLLKNEASTSKELADAAREHTRAQIHRRVLDWLLGTGDAESVHDKLAQQYLAATNSRSDQSSVETQPSSRQLSGAAAVSSAGPEAVSKPAHVNTATAPSPGSDAGPQPLVASHKPTLAPSADFSSTRIPSLAPAVPAPDSPADHLSLDTAAIEAGITAPLTPPVGPRMSMLAEICGNMALVSSDSLLAELPSSVVLDAPPSSALGTSAASDLRPLHELACTRPSIPVSMALFADGGMRRMQPSHAISMVLDASLAGCDAVAMCDLECGAIREVRVVALESLYQWGQRAILSGSRDEIMDLHQVPGVEITAESEARTARRSRSKSLTADKEQAAEDTQSDPGRSEPTGAVLHSVASGQADGLDKSGSVREWLDFVGRHAGGFLAVLQEACREPLATYAVYCEEASERSGSAPCLTVAQVDEVSGEEGGEVEGQTPGLRWSPVARWFVSDGHVEWCTPPETSRSATPTTPASTPADPYPSPRRNASGKIICGPPGVQWRSPIAPFRPPVAMLCIRSAEKLYAYATKLQAHGRGSPRATPAAAAPTPATAEGSSEEEVDDEQYEQDAAAAAYELDPDVCERMYERALELLDLSQHTTLWAFVAWRIAELKLRAIRRRAQPSLQEATGISCQSAWGISGDGEMKLDIQANWPCVELPSLEGQSQEAVVADIMSSRVGHTPAKVQFAVQKLQQQWVSAAKDAAQSCLRWLLPALQALSRTDSTSHSQSNVEGGATPSSACVINSVLLPKLQRACCNAYITLAKVACCRHEYCEGLQWSRRAQEVAEIDLTTLWKASLATQVLDGPTQVKEHLLLEIAAVRTWLAVGIALGQESSTGAPGIDTSKVWQGALDSLECRIVSSVPLELISCPLPVLQAPSLNATAEATEKACVEAAAADRTAFEEFFTAATQQTVNFIRLHCVPALRLLGYSSAGFASTTALQLWGPSLDGAAAILHAQSVCPLLRTFRTSRAARLISQMSHDLDSSTAPALRALNSGLKVVLSAATCAYKPIVDAIHSTEPNPSVDCSTVGCRVLVHCQAADYGEYFSSSAGQSEMASLVADASTALLHVADVQHGKGVFSLCLDSMKQRVVSMYGGLYALQSMFRLSRDGPSFDPKAKGPLSHTMDQQWQWLDTVLQLYQTAATIDQLSDDSTAQSAQRSATAQRAHQRLIQTGARRSVEALCHFRRQAVLRASTGRWSEVDALAATTSLVRTMAAISHAVQHRLNLDEHSEAGLFGSALLELLREGVGAELWLQPFVVHKSGLTTHVELVWCWLASAMVKIWCECWSHARGIGMHDMVTGATDVVDGAHDLMLQLWLKLMKTSMAESPAAVDVSRAKQAYGGMLKAVQHAKVGDRLQAMYAAVQLEW